MEEQEKEVSEQKIKKLRNLKYFRDWTDDQITEWVKLRKPKEVPPANPQDILEGIPTSTEAPAFENVVLPDELEKKYKKYLQDYRKEYAVDMNDANDAESLRQLVRYVIQSETLNALIQVEMGKKLPNHTVLKGYGDYQRTLQQNINEVSDRLGISRKQRREKTVDDIPQYIRELQEKAKNFWERKTVGVRCEKCRIELARFWVNFPTVTTTIREGGKEIEKSLPAKILFEIPCDKCKETVIYRA